MFIRFCHRSAAVSAASHSIRLPIYLPPALSKLVDNRQFLRFASTKRINFPISGTNRFESTSREYIFIVCKCIDVETIKRFTVLSILCRIDCYLQWQPSRHVHAENFPSQVWATNRNQHRQCTRAHSTTARLEHYCTNQCAPAARKIGESYKMKCEFKRLPGDVVPQHYDLKLKPCLTSFTFDGQTSVQIKVRILTTFFYHSVSFVCVWH